MRSTSMTHVYFMPGMAANPSIFEYIQLPDDQYTIHWLKWKIPYKNECMHSYITRMLEDVIHPHPVLILGKFATFDFVSDDKKLYIELKNRNNYYSKYPTTMISLNKIEEAQKLYNCDCKIKFVFKFTDGIYYYDYKPDDKELIYSTGGRCDRKDNKGKIMYEFKKYCFIPINLLTEIKLNY